MIKDNKIFAMVSTKGGGGKTTISTMVLPTLFAGTESNITIYGIDDNNINKLKSEHINFKNLKVKDSENILDEIEMQKIMKSDDISIIDVGGGSDTLNLLNIIKKSVVDGVTFIIPINDDIEQIYNLENTINAIQKASKNPTIYLVLNRVHQLNKDAIEEQFVGIYGSDRYGIKPLSNKILEQIDAIYFVESAPIFSILKNIYTTTLLDAYIEAEDLLQNLETKKVEWVEKGKEYFKKQNIRVRLAYDVIELTKRIYKLGESNV